MLHVLGLVCICTFIDSTPLDELYRILLCGCCIGQIGERTVWY